MLHNYDQRTTHLLRIYSGHCAERTVRLTSRDTSRVRILEDMLIDHKGINAEVASLCEHMGGRKYHLEFPNMSRALDPDTVVA